MTLPGLCYPNLFPPHGNVLVSEVVELSPVPGPELYFSSPADFDPDAPCMELGTLEATVVNLASPETEALIASVRPTLNSTRLRWFDALIDRHLDNLHSTRLPLAERVLSDTSLQADIVCIARKIATEAIIESALAVQPILGEEHALELEEHLHDALARLEASELLFVDQEAEGSLLRRNEDGVCVKQGHGKSTSLIGVRSNSIKNILKLTVHELLHAAEPEELYAEEKSRYSTWFRERLPKFVVSTEQLALWEYAPRTEANYSRLALFFGWESAGLPIHFFRSRIANWHEVLIDDLAISGLNLFIMNTPAATPPEFVFGREALVFPYYETPASEDIFIASLDGRGYPIAHLMAAEGRRAIADLGPKAEEALHRLETLAYGAMFFATPQAAKSSDTPSALETRFIALIKQAVDDLGEIRFLFFLSMLGTCAQDFRESDVIELTSLTSS